MRTEPLNQQTIDQLNRQGYTTVENDSTPIWWCRASWHPCDATFNDGYEQRCGECDEPAVRVWALPPRPPSGLVTDACDRAVRWLGSDLPIPRPDSGLSISDGHRMTATIIHALCDGVEALCAVVDARPSLNLTIPPDVEPIRDRLSTAVRGVQPGAPWRVTYIDDVRYLLALLVADPGLASGGAHRHGHPPGAVAPLDGEGALHRAVDHDTSERAQGTISDLGRRANHRHRLAAAFYAAGNAGLTDEEAAIAAGLTVGSPWKRCGDLREGGWLEWTGAYRKTTLSKDAKVWRMTDAGRRAYPVASRP